MWRPSRRTALEAHVGRRYGSMTYYGSFAYAPNKNLSFTIAYAMLGNITLTPNQSGLYLSMHATF